MGDLWDDATARRLALVLQGGYPPTYETIPALGAAGPITLTTCPSGVWRVVLFASGYPTLATVAGAWVTLRVLRGGVEHTIASTGTRVTVAYVYAVLSPLRSPLILQPGDTLLARDENAVAAVRLQGSCAYVDVPIPSNDGLEARRIRRG